MSYYTSENLPNRLFYLIEIRTLRWSNAYSFFDLSEFSINTFDFHAVKFYFSFHLFAIINGASSRNAVNRLHEIANYPLVITTFRDQESDLVRVVDKHHCPIYELIVMVAWSGFIRD